MSSLCRNLCKIPHVLSWTPSKEEFNSVPTRTAKNRQKTLGTESEPGEAEKPKRPTGMLLPDLNKLRLENHMTAREVRSYMQPVTVRTIYKWERGDGLPQAVILLALMQLYGADRVQMITEEGAELSSVRILGEKRLAA